MQEDKLRPSSMFDIGTDEEVTCDGEVTRPSSRSEPGRGGG